jgi:hypothetical protein
MVTIVKIGGTAKDLFGKKINEGASKKLDARKHLGKVKWGEDAIEYQQSQRQQWDEGSR